MAAANLVPPEALKQIKPYITLATQLEQKDEKIIAYYCRLYAVQQGMQINKSLPECKKFFFQLMDILEATKKQNPNDEAIHSEIVGQAVVERYALKIFEKADDDDRQARFNKNLVKQFYSSGLLFDVLNCFGELSEDLIVKKQYAKRKAMYLNRCFQTGETPIPGPLVGDGFNDEGEFGENRPNEGSSNTSYNNSYANNSSGASNYNPPPNVDRPSSSSKGKNTPIPPTQYNDTFHNQEQTESNEGAIPAELMQKAQKLCKYAQSALQYDDIQTAITNLEQCLRVLKTGKE